MDWVSGAARDPRGKLQLEVTTKDGSNLLDLTRLRSKLDVDARVHMNLRLRLGDLQRRPPGNFLTRLGQAQHPARAQSVFEGEVDGSRVYIPAQLLIVACFGSHHVLRENLLTPCGLQRLADLEAVGRTSEGLAQRLQWILRSPTARASWASVYRQALDGRFDLQLPNALAELSVWGRMDAGTLLVTRAQLVALTPTEASGGVELTSPRLIFDHKAGPRTYPVQGRPSSWDARVAPLLPERRLSDTQWARVQPMLATALGRDKPRRRGARPRHELRELIDVMVLKLSAPRPWREVSGDKMLVQRAKSLLPALQDKGIWGKLLDTLGECA